MDTETFGATFSLQCYRVAEVAEVVEVLNQKGQSQLTVVLMPLG
jgi:hypothetical protein